VAAGAMIQCLEWTLERAAAWRNRGATPAN